MAAVQIFSSALEIIPDCNRRFLGCLVQEVMKSRRDAIAKNQVNIRLPSVHEVGPVALDDEDYDFEKENADASNSNDEELPRAVIFDLTQLVLEVLLVAPTFPKRIPKRTQSFGDLTELEKNTAASRKAKSDDATLLSMAVGPLERPATAEPRLTASSSTTSFTSIDDPDYLPELYADEAVALLLNEFRWLFVNAIKAAFKLNGRDFTKTRNFLIGLILAEMADEDTSFISAVDPVHPQYPRRLNELLAKTAKRTHLIKDGNKFELLKVVRKVSPTPINVTHPRLATEIATLRTTKSEEKPIHCLCCDDDTTVDTLVTCVEGHIYCQPCLVDYVKAKIQDGVKQGYLECMQHECSAPFSQVVLISRLPNDLMEQLDERIAMANLNQADIPDLVRCPKCNTVFELDASLTVLECIVCKFASCRRCHLPWNDEHLGKRCEELESKDESRMRQLFEERMTAELIRPCPKCRTPLMKVEGCNKLTCSCQATLCYVCREPFIGYDHFCQHPRNPGQPCDQCRRCSLWIDPAAEDAARIKKIDDEAKALLEREKTDRLKGSTTVFAENNANKKKTISDQIESLSSSLASASFLKSDAPCPRQTAPPPQAPAQQQPPPLPRRNPPVGMPPPLPPLFPGLDQNAAIEQVLLMANRNDVAGLQQIVRQYGVGVLNMPSRRERSNEVVLHRAAVLGHHETVRYVIDLPGINLSPKDADGQTPLHKATWRNNVRVMELLLDKGVPVDERGHNVTAHNITALHIAARYGRLEAAELLLARGIGLEVKESQFGDTPLLTACHFGHLRIVEMLLDRGANIKAKNLRGNTPLHTASGSGYQEVVKLLIARGAPVNQLNNARRAPLHNAAYRGNLASVRALIDAGADLRARDINGRDPAETARVLAKKAIEDIIRFAQRCIFGRKM